MSDQRQSIKPYLSIDGTDVSKIVQQLKWESRDNYWFPVVYPDAGVEESQLSKVNCLSLTWKNCYVELDGKNVSTYFGSIHLKENSDPKRAWEGYELIMSTPNPFPDDWQEYLRRFPQDVPIGVRARPYGESDRQQEFECEMYVHYREHRWSIDRPYNQGRMIMRSLANPRSLPPVGQ